MTDSVGGATSNPNWVTESNVIDAVYADKDEKDISVQNFLDMMIQQLKNQDFMNPVDDAQYLTQMAQFATMQQMEEMAYNSKSSYVTGLVGKEVTVAKLGIGGKLNQVTAPVEKVSFAGGDFTIHVKGQEYKLSQLMEVKGSAGDGKVHLADPSELDLFLEDLTGDSATITWEIPTKNDEIAKELRYSVYYSTEENFDTVDAVKKSENCLFFETKDLTKASIYNLEAGTTYYANVVVKDSEGNEAVYKKITFTTPD